MIGVWIILSVLLIAAAIAVWRVEILRWGNARPVPRHVRARGEARAFPLEPKGGDDT